MANYFSKQPSSRPIKYQGDALTTGRMPRHEAE